MAGKVWLVGAGPGDSGLLTLRGKEVLDQAEVVVYDALIGPGILQYIPDTAKLVYAGKRAGKHALEQAEINQVLLDEALRGRRVVRLKGGDPFLFGRGGEELELLLENGVPFEIVPGVSSAFAVPAYQGIPATHRDFCSSVHIITGHRRKGQSDDIDYGALARTGGTLIFLMGIAAMPDLCRKLLAAGMDPETPAAVLEKGTTARQRGISATLATLEGRCARSGGVATPAILMVGKVCALADAFSWYEKRPLSGTRVLVTRPRESISGLAAMLRQRGAEVLELPAIRTVAVTGENAENADGKRGRIWTASGGASSHAIAPTLAECIRGLERGAYAWLVFTSPAGVRIFFEKLMEDSDVRALANVKIAVLGEGTRKSLLQYGCKADFTPSSYEGAALGRELANVCSKHDSILIPRAAIGNQALIEGLLQGPDLRITDLPIYETVYERSRVLDEKALLENGEIDFVVFTSASTVRGFAAAVGETDYSAVRAVCIGRQTQDAAKGYGMQTFVAEKATLASLVECVERAARAVREEGEKS